MNRFLCFLLFACCFVQQTNAQISTHELPISSTRPLPSRNLQPVPTKVMPSLNRTALQLSDAADEQSGLPPRFGKDFPVEYNLENSGIWYTYPDGDRVWRLTIKAKGAKSINFLYDNFYLPPGAKFFVYNYNKTHVLGAFTERNNKVDRRFATGLVYGDYVTLEYYEPAKVAGQGSISIEKVVHGYRYISLPTEYQKAFGDSGSCNVNTVCNQGDGWRDEIKGVGLMLLNGTRWCSGSLINNTSEDNAPYFLTANHCISNFDAIDNPNGSTLSFYWRYESPDCGHNVSDGSTSLSTTGATIIANSGNPGEVEASDFALLELTENPVEENYDVYFNGFDATNTAVTGVTGIHHPAGDVKKISMDNNAITSNNYYSSSNAAGATHWRVLDWNSGTTEGGSSGSPLFSNATKRIIGDLSGGDAACGNDDPDWYGKVWYSWTNGGATDARRRLRDWLNPTNGANDFVDGKSPGPVVIIPKVRFIDTEITQPEGSSCNNRSVQVALSISDAPEVTTTVNISATGSADGSDYTLSATTIRFPANSTANRFVTIDIIEDTDVEPLENIILTINNVSGGNSIADATNQSYTLNLTNDDRIPSPNLGGMLFSSDFETGLNGAVSNNLSGSTTNFTLGQTSDVTSQYWSLENTNTTQFVFVSDDACSNCASRPVQFKLPTVNTIGFSDLSLSFSHAFANVPSESAYVGVSTDGTNFTTIQTIENTSNDQGGSVYVTPWVDNIVVDLSTYVGNSDLTVAIFYDDGNGWEYGMALDNIVLQGTGGQSVQSTVNSTSGFAEMQVASMSTVHFFDQNTGRIMLSLDNQSSFDYGCTRVEIDRAGTSVNAGWEPNSELTNKTYRITPENNTATGNYQVILYYTAAEMAGWEADNQLSQSKDDIKIIQSSVAIPNTDATTATVQNPTIESFGDDFTYQAGFTGSLGGFALGNVGNAALATEWRSFIASAKNENIELNWSTEKYQDNVGFNLMRSMDGKSFTEVAVVATRTQVSNQVEDYIYIDQQVQAGQLYYYQIAQVDVSGKRYLSPIQSAMVARNTDFQWHPNPVSDQLIWSSKDGISKNSTIEVFSATGQRIFRKTISTAPNQVIIDTNNWQSGIYIIKSVDTQGKVYKQKVIKY